MDNEKDDYYCRVCGLEQEDLPWDGKIPSHNICECCGVEFGYEDCQLKAIYATRERWIRDGAKWFEPKMRPKNWSLEDQLKQIPEEYK